MRLTSLLIAVFITLALPSLAQAQATPQSRLAWDQMAASQTEAAGLAYRHYDDGSSTGTVLSDVTCTGSVSPFVCSAPFPAFTPGPTHSIAVSASNVAGESLKSTPLSFTFIVVPNVPTNLRLIP